MQPDIVLMDLVMPVMDGFEATRRIRNIPDLKNVIVVAVSASLSEHFQDGYPTEEFDDYITKPLDADELLKRLQTHLKAEWIYAEESEENLPADVPVVPPMEHIETLYNLALRGDIFRIMEYTKKFEAQFNAFGNKINQLAREFKINQLEEFLKQCMERET
jgi:DNA-binding response OmpR family regulator